MAGRPSKLTPERKANLIGAIRKGSYLKAACRLAGITEQTFYNWMERGEKAKKGEYFEFFEAARDAEAQAEIRAVTQWQSFMDKDWRAARDFLRYRFGRNGWSDISKIEHSGPEGEAIEVEFSIERTTGRDIDEE
tara:strand:+ start:1603 stop:2007 length:405 start_codon:yes stop_codon:yes gene_type:complete